MQNITDSESGVTVSDEPYMADERVASKLVPVVPPLLCHPTCEKVPL